MKPQNTSSENASSKLHSFLEKFEPFIKMPGGKLQVQTTDFFPVATSEIVKSLDGRGDLADTPKPSGHISVIDDLSKWIINASEEDKLAAQLNLPRPPAGLHHVPGKYPIFYDFLNLDIVLNELSLAGASMQGRFLDFGCSTGRNLAVMNRAFPGQFELFGVDPSGPSIEWLSENIEGVTAVQSEQTPPLGFPDDHFDTVIAKSIWTHFSPSAAKSWFEEVSRCLKPGGYFFFSTHGPHDVASRIIRDIPRPKYERYAGHPNWTRDEFLVAIAEGLVAEGFFFKAFKEVGHQGDLSGVENPTTSDWGLTFMLPKFVEGLLPNDLSIVRYDTARTGSRHDAYVVRKKS
ncbi:class I SAM-dependent methyltransferase [Leisingera sp. ANG59]|uniref:class I SAM-dependent methyltransferase n=1 Tax=Leisingera sp. ANG59 TaxID=2675221 RepID=UPI001571C87C|nr:class I SAM-dependent methyltransferase [Leisingera sp. ANG59]NSY36853.1 methyltransferase domain-containing protein [Leisingera sp. ANG59]